MKTSNFASKAFIFLSANIGCAIINFLVAIILSRYVGPKEYGELAVYMTYTGIATALISLSLEGSVSIAYFRKSTKEFRNHVITTIFIICILLMIVLNFILLFDEYLQQFIGLTTQWLLIGAICAAMQAIVNLKLTLWMADGNAVTYAIFQMGQSIAFTILTFALFKLTNSGWNSRSWAMLITTFIFLAIAIYSLIKEKQCLGRINLEEMKSALGFGIPLIPHVSGSILFSSADRLLVNALLGPTSTGLYQLAAQFGSIVMMTADAINKTFSPWLYKNLKDASIEFKRRIVKITYVYFITMITFGLASYTIPFNMASFVAGANYSEANELIPYFILAQCIGGMYFMVVNYVFYTGKTVYLSLSTLMSGFIGIVSGYFLISEFGIIGGGVAFIVSKAVHFSLSWMISAKVFPMPWNLLEK